MVVCATQKAMRNLHLERGELSAPPSTETQHWYANLLRILRVKYYLPRQGANHRTAVRGRRLVPICQLRPRSGYR